VSVFIVETTAAVQCLCLL